MPYDNAGNQQAANGDTLRYEADNRLTQEYDNSFHTHTTYAYDGHGQRVQKAGPGGTTVYVYDALGRLAGEFASTAVHAPPCGTCYAGYDHLGSVRLVTDQSGNVVSRHDYLPFGEEISSGTAGRTSQFGATDNLSQRFTGKERDQESGLDYFGARYYGSALGRFTSPDEFQGGLVDPFTGKDLETNHALPYADITDPQTLNKYAYTRNNPLRYIDPDGHDFWDYAKGVINAYTSDNAAGIGRMGGGNQDYQLGQSVGDAVATITGGLEVLSGGAGQAGGLALDATGAGAVAGVPVNVVSAGVIAHGADTAAQGAVHLFKAGGAFSSKTKQEVKEAAGGKCQNCGVETTEGQKSQKGVTPPGNEGQTDHIVPKSKGGTNEPSNAQHLCRDCNRRKSDKMPNEQ